jgi:pimeloyl-ACP methyl ester carboxylesterase
MSIVEKVTSRDGTSIAVEREGDGPALVLVDAAGSFRGFGPTAALAGALAPGFTVVTYDRRGRGESTDAVPYAVEKEVEDLRAVIDSAGGSAFVYGFSSGAVLALHAAAAGLPITKLALLEPPLPLDDEPPAEPEPDLRAEVAELVAAGRRGDAVEHFNTGIGVPPEIVAGMREAPYWPALEALAHTLLYDMTITSSLPADVVETITTPTLVLDSDGSDERLRAWARGVAAALPAGQHRSLPGEWHGPATEDLARALTEFFNGGRRAGSGL